MAGSGGGWMSGAESRFPSWRVIGFGSDQTINQLFVSQSNVPNATNHPTLWWVATRSRTLPLADYSVIHSERTEGITRRFCPREKPSEPNRYPQIMGLYSSKSTVMSITVTQGVSIYNIYAAPLVCNCRSSPLTTITSIDIFLWEGRSGEWANDYTDHLPQLAIAHALFAGQPYDTESNSSSSFSSYTYRTWASTQWRRFKIYFPPWPFARHSCTGAMLEGGHVTRGGKRETLGRKKRNDVLAQLQLAIMGST